MPIAAAIPAIIGAAGSIGGALLSKKANVGGPSPQQNELTSLASSNLKDASGKANELFPVGKSLLDLSKSTFQAPLDYYNTIAGGSRGDVLSKLAPQISQITGANQANTNALDNLAPRSGASTDVRAGNFYTPQRSIGTLLQSARPEAFDKLGTLAGQTGSLGEYTAGDAMRTLTGASQGATSLNDQLLRQQVNQQNQQKDLGSGIGNLLYMLTKGLKFGGGDKSSSSGSSGSSADTFDQFGY